MKKAQLIGIILLFSFQFHAQYVLVWSDEFSSNTLDQTKWAHEIGGNGWGNNEAQYYTNSANNLSISSGELTITALQENFGSNPYTSAKISSKGLMELQYGKIEARAKCPMGQGLWPAFWMLGANINTVSWPACGEIDIMEHINNDNKIFGTAHWDNLGHIYNGNAVNTDPSQFHVYAIEWNPNTIKWFIDGSIFHSINISNGVNGTSEFHNDFYVILNLAVGGNWPGYPNASTVFPAEFVVDYVRVYKDQAEAGLTQLTETENVQIFPNPVNDFLQLQNLNKDEKYNISIVGMDGKICKEITEFYSNEQLKINDLNSGFYFLELSNEKGKISRIPFVKNL